MAYSVCVVLAVKCSMASHGSVIVSVEARS